MTLWWVLTSVPSQRDTQCDTTKISHVDETKGPQEQALRINTYHIDTVVAKKFYGGGNNTKMSSQNLIFD